MSRFLTPLDMRLMVDPNGMPLTNRDGRQLYRLLSDFKYQSDIAGKIVTAPAGFVTDLASIPKLLLPLFGETAQEPSVPHDLAYSTGCLPRDIADAMLREACLLTGVSRWRAELIWAGVRVGGGSHWEPATS